MNVEKENLEIPEKSCKKGGGQETDVPVPGPYYEKVYSNSTCILGIGITVCFSFDSYSIRPRNEETMLYK